MGSTVILINLLLLPILCATPIYSQGVWRPVGMKNPVYDYPLCMCDGSTLASDDLVRFDLDSEHIGGSGDGETFTTVLQAVRHSEEQRWFFYPHMTTKEVLVFRHFTKGQFFVNAHAAVDGQELPDGMDTRTSVENRLFIY